MVNRDALHCQRPFNVDLRCRQSFDNHVEKRQHVLIAIVGRKACITVYRRRKDHVFHGKFKLLIGGAQVHHQIKGIIHNLFRTGSVAVNLVDHHHDGKARIDGMSKHKARLRHRAFSGINKQKSTVCHLEHSLHLATKISVARRINDVDLGSLIFNGNVFCQNGNSALTLLIVGVQNTFLNLLIFTEGVRCLQHLINQRCLTMVNVGNDGNVSDVLLTHKLHFSLSAHVARSTYAQLFKRLALVL